MFAIEYRTVGNQCAVVLESLRLPISNEDALELLIAKGFKIIEVDMISLARRCIGVSQYKRRANPSEAPAIVDCSSFVKWLYGERGIWLPRISIQQRKFGLVVPVSEVVAGDLVFTSGFGDCYENNPDDGVSHVGIATGEGTVVHAANQTTGVVEVPQSNFTDKPSFRGVRRYILKEETVITLGNESGKTIEWFDDYRWIILRSLPR